MNKTSPVYPLIVGAVLGMALPFGMGFGCVAGWELLLTADLPLLLADRLRALWIAIQFASLFAMPGIVTGLLLGVILRRRLVLQPLTLGIALVALGAAGFLLAWPLYYGLGGMESTEALRSADRHARSQEWSSYRLEFSSVDSLASTVYVHRPDEGTMYCRIIYDWVECVPDAFPP